MTVQEVITRVRQLAGETDTTNTHASDSVILGWCNEAVLALCSVINTLPKVDITGEVAAATVVLSTSVLRLDYAAISDDAATPNYQPLETIDFVNFVRINPNWENQPTGKPTTFVRMTETDWMMWPAPNATWTGKTLSLYGAVKPADMTSATETPSVPLVLHSCLPHYCAWLFFLLLNNPEKAAGNFSAYDALRKLNTRTATSTVGSLQSFKIRGY